MSFGDILPHFCPHCSFLSHRVQDSCFKGISFWSSSSAPLFPHLQFITCSCFQISIMIFLHPFFSPLVSPQIFYLSSLFLTDTDLIAAVLLFTDGFLPAWWPWENLLTSSCLHVHTMIPWLLARQQQMQLTNSIFSKDRKEQGWSCACWMAFFVVWLCENVCVPPHMDNPKLMYGTCFKCFYNSLRCLASLFIQPF